MDRKQQVMHEFGGKYFGSKESLPNMDQLVPWNTSSFKFYIP